MSALPPQISVWCEAHGSRQTDAAGQGKARQGKARQGKARQVESYVDGNGGKAPKPSVTLAPAKPSYGLSTAAV